MVEKMGGMAASVYIPLSFSAVIRGHQIFFPLYRLLTDN
jgi:hypothetical protein